MDRSACFCSGIPLSSILCRGPQAISLVSGDGEHPSISGIVRFYQTNLGVLVWAEVRGLPKDELPCSTQIFGFHIHAGSNCGGSAEDPFGNAMSHYDPKDCAHPHHAGDFPPLFGNDGLAFSLFLTNRFSVHEVIGRTVIIHDHPDDLTTQPAGNSGKKIACGVIRNARAAAPEA